MAIVIVRTLIIYFSLLLTMRLLGKRQLGEMELSEFVVAALIADLAAHPLQDMGIPLLNGLLPVFILFCCEIVISGIALKNVRLRGIIYGKPSILISHGKIDQKEMHKNRFTCDELMQELRNQGGIEINKIEYAILETDGRLNVIPLPEERPVTAAQMNAAPAPGGYPTILIDDGRLMGENLSVIGRDRNWLNKQLKTLGFSSPHEVFLMTADNSGRVFICKKEINK